MSDGQVQAAERLQSACRSPVAGHQPVPFFFRNPEACILHSQRIKDLLLQELTEALSGHDLNHRAKYVRTGAVPPSCSGCESQGLLAQAVAEGDRVHPAALTDFLLILFKHPRRGLPGSVRVRITQPGGHPQQFQDPRRAVCSAHLSVRCNHLRIPETRQKPVHFRLEIQLAPVRKDHRRRCRNRFGLAVQPEDRIPLHRFPGGNIRHARRGIAQIFPFLPDQDAQSRRFPVLHCLLQAAFHFVLQIHSSRILLTVCISQTIL